MNPNVYWRLFVLGVLLHGLACVIPAEKSDSAGGDVSRYVDDMPFGRKSGGREPLGREFGGKASGFKVPVPPGYDWEVTQSWAEHCDLCNAKGYDWDYCAQSMSHNLDCCKYSWDFNLPGVSDYGKPVLATGDGVILDINDNTGWGITVVIDHGDGVCSRYAHMVEESTDHLEIGGSVCQGLRLGEIGDTGSAEGPHLHFQFENCESGESLKMGFDDGNGIPVCTRGNDVYNASGKYSFLKLTNEIREDCSDSGQLFGGSKLPAGGWRSNACGALSGCPLIPNCGRGSGHEFSDYYHLGDRTAQAASYLYSECALDGKADGKLHPFDLLTRAEALKVPMYLFGLMDGCGFSVDFSDVSDEDWFFNVVACAVRNGIVNNMAEAFRPNDLVTFGEASKMLVNSAARAGVIQALEPAVGHFEKIGKSHWAYRYVETLYSYGGVVPQSLTHQADSKVERREYVIMAASLSPCFCANVGCDSDCTCNQASFACTDPSDKSPGTGGSGSDDDEGDDGGGDDEGDDGDRDGDESGGDDEGDDGDRDGDESGGDDEGDDDDPAANPVRDLDLEIPCSVDFEHSRCEGGSTILYIECSLVNNSGETLRINNLVMKLLDPQNAQWCQVTDSDLRRGEGVKVVEAGESEELNGHYEITCREQPADDEIDVAFDLVEKVAGVKTRYNDVAQSTIAVIEDPFIRCAQIGTPEGNRPPQGEVPQGGAPQGEGVPGNGGGQPPQDGAGAGGENDEGAREPDGRGAPAAFDCDPETGYTLWMWSPEGNFEVAATGLDIPIRSRFLPGMRMFVRFDCVELPGAVLVHGGPEGVHVWRESDALPPFALRVPYDGPLVINPPGPPDVTIHDFATDTANLNLHVRIPPE